MTQSRMTCFGGCCLFATVIFCLCFLTNGFAPSRYKNVTGADGSYLGLEAILGDTNFMPMPSAPQSPEEYTTQDHPSDFLPTYISYYVPRQLRPNTILNYTALPNWLRMFLESYFVAYFPPKADVSPISTTNAPVTTTIAPSTKTIAPSTKTIAPSTKTIAPLTKTIAPSTKTLAPSPTSAPSNQFLKDLLEYQNMKRTAGGLRPVVWDEDLANYCRKYMAMQDRYKQCAFEHSKSSGRAKIGPYTRAGENLYMSWGFTPTGKKVVDAWYDEINCYKYGKVGDSCTRWRGPKCDMNDIMVGHFTQMMWAQTSHMGCAVHNCNSCRSRCPQVYVACTYASAEDGFGGNVWGDTPFDINVAEALNLETCRSARSDIDYLMEYLDDGAQVENLYIDKENTAMDVFEAAGSVK